MIRTAEILPAPALAPYVRCYTLREFETAETPETPHGTLVRPWHGTSEVVMPFFLKALPLCLLHPLTGRLVCEGRPMGISGLSAQYNGQMSFRGHYLFFEIVFRPNGFTRLFQIPAHELTNHIFDLEEVVRGWGPPLFEQLAGAGSLPQMGRLADAQLLARLQKARSLGGEAAIAHAAQLVGRAGGSLSVARLAQAANMSPRNLERLFVRQVGVGPKHFCALTRFSRALGFKLAYPAADWTAVALDHGYYDQMHFIKDFKRFAGTTPSCFWQQTPLTQEKYLSRVA